MYHTRFRGTHGEIGFHYGDLLRRNGRLFLENVPFPIDGGRVRFALACLPFYEKHYPEIVQEIRGLAEGQQCPFDKLAGVLFSMYCIMPSAHCSCFAVRSANGVYFGRNSDFLTCMEKLYVNSIYYFTQEGSLSFAGNTTAFLEMEDGVNEKGLAIGLTSVYPSLVKPGLNAGMVLRLVLEKCACVQEVLELVGSLPLASSQTFVVADSGGEIALLECNAKRFTAVRPREEHAFVCATNLFHTEEMKGFNNLAEDNWQADERYQTLFRCLSENTDHFQRGDGFDLLSGRRGFLCQYDRKTGKDTVWSMLYDVYGKEIFRAEGNPSRRKFRHDRRFQIASDLA